MWRTAFQLPLAAWHEWLVEPALADAILDRIVHGAHKIGKTLGLPTERSLPSGLPLLQTATTSTENKITPITNHLTEAEAEARPYVEGVEEARLKKELGIEYRGSPAIFDKAAEIAAEIFLSGSAQGGKMDSAQANRLAIWAAK